MHSTKRGVEEPLEVFDEQPERKKDLTRGEKVVVIILVVIVLLALLLWLNSTHTFW
jgi:cell division protein FtsL